VTKARRRKSLSFGDGRVHAGVAMVSNDSCGASFIFGMLMGDLVPVRSEATFASFTNVGSNYPMILRTRRFLSQLP
jgi:hypothetical protein